MINMVSEEMFGGYCYGPVDLISMRKGDSTMWLQLSDSAGKKAQAVYSGCVYWRLEEEQEGMHIMLVRKVTADQLIERKNSVSILALRKNSDDIEGLIREWEKEGLHFYLHYGAYKEAEYLVVAKSLEYRERI